MNLLLSYPNRERNKQSLISEIFTHQARIHRKIFEPAYYAITNFE